VDRVKWKNLAGGTSSAATVSTSSTTSGAGSEASKPPKQILADAAAAVRSGPGYAMSGTIVQSHQQLRLKLTTTSARSLD